MIRAVVFDFDGLVLDTEVPVYESWAAVYEANGAVLDLDTWRGIVGTTGFDPAAHLEELVGHPLDWDAIHRARKRHRDELLALEIVRPGVVEWLTQAKAAGLPLGVASSSTSDWVVGHLTRLGLVDAFACIKCADDVGAAKPSPASYLAVLADLGLEGCDGLAVEDSLHGVVAAKAAGMRCVAVPNDLTEGMDFGAADLVVASLADLTLAEAVERVMETAAEAR